MPDDQSIDRGELLALTAEIVAAHVGNNAVRAARSPALIQSVFDTLRGLATDEPAAPVELTPAVPIRRSVTDDHIVCLEDGKKLKMLKRHLMTDHGMTPEEYRATGASGPTTRWWRRPTPRSARRSRSRSASAASRPRRPHRGRRNRSAGARPKPDRARLHQVHRPRLREPCSYRDALCGAVSGG